MKQKNVLAKAHRKPEMRMQKRPKGQHDAYVILGGKRIGLGRWNSPEADAKYHRILHEWNVNGKQLLETPPDVTIAEMTLLYLKHCAAYYAQRPNTLTHIKSALAPLTKLYAELPAYEFGPKRLKVVRAAIIQQGDNRKRPYTRKGVNEMVGIVRRMFRWAVSEELIPATVATALAMLEPLRAGKCNLRDNPPRQPVAEKMLHAVDPHLNDSSRSLMWLMYYTGARCAELVNLRPRDIDRSGSLWEVTLHEHKTAHVTGQPRHILIGKRGQQAIRELLLRRKDNEYLFQPADHFEKIKARSVCPRRPDQKPNPRKTDRTINGLYDTTAFRKALGHACKQAGVPPFTPHQLRHSALTNIRRELGLEAAQAVGGHNNICTTEIYAAVSETRAREAMERLG